MKIKSLFLTIVVVILLSPNTVNASPNNGVPAYKQGFYYPWQKDKKAEVTQTIHETAAVDFIVGTMSTDVGDRPKQKITAVKDGIIKFAKDDSGKSCNIYNSKTKACNGGTACDGSANLIVIEHPGNPTTYSWYWHVAKGSIPPEFRQVGTPVRHGEIIGQQGNSGTICTSGDPKTGAGTHLHFFVSEGYESRSGNLPKASKLINDIQFTKEKNKPVINSLKLNSVLSSTNTPNKQTQIRLGSYCLDLQDRKAENFAQIQIWRECTSGDNQSWTMEARKSANFWLKSPLKNPAGENLCIDVTDGDPGRQLQVYGCVSSTINTNQVWQFMPLPDGTYLIKSPTFGLCMQAQDAEGDSSPVLLAKCNPKSSLQKWTITER